MRKGCAEQVEIAVLPQFLAIDLSFWRSNLISCERLAIGPLKSQFYLSFSIEPHFVQKGCAGQLEIAILPQFLAIEPHFVRKGCVSCRLVGTAPAPAFIHGLYGIFPGMDRNRRNHFRCTSQSTGPVAQGHDGVQMDTAARARPAVQEPPQDAHGRRWGAP